MISMLPALSSLLSAFEQPWHGRLVTVGIGEGIGEEHLAALDELVVVAVAVDAGLKLGVGCALVSLVRDVAIEIEHHNQYDCHDKNLLHNLSVLFLFLHCSFLCLSS